MHLSVGDVAVIGVMAHEQTHSHVNRSNCGSVDIAILARGDCESTDERREMKL